MWLCVGGKFIDIAGKISEKFATSEFRNGKSVGNKTGNALVFA
jgi:hypothetical protein